MTRLTAVLAMVACAGYASADIVVPNANTGVAGGGTLNTVVRDLPRAYQFTVPGAEVAGIGGAATGMTWRPGITASNPPVWPASAVNWTDYEVYIGEFNGVLGAALSTTFTTNVIGGTEIMVRDGPWSIAPGAFVNTGVAPNAFGTAILDFNVASFTFDPLKNYVVTLRHPGSGFVGPPANIFMDTVASAGNFRAISGTTMAATTGAAAAFTVTKFIAVPAPAGAALLGLGGLFAARRRRS